MDFDTFHFSPYTIQSDDDDDALVTKSQIKAMNEKLDTLLASSSQSSTSAYSEAIVQALVAILVK